MRGKGAKAGPGDFKVEQQRKARLAPFDRKLRAFRVGEALDCALETRRPECPGPLYCPLELAPEKPGCAQRWEHPRFGRLCLMYCTRHLDTLGGSLYVSVYYATPFVLLQ
eukprot:4969185-Pyramimonas_sp.AAC.2